MSYTLGQAAIAVGKSKATISKAIKSGKITAAKQDNGSYKIEPSELHRVYPATAQLTVEGERLETPSETVVNGSEIIELRVKLNAAQERIEDLKEDRDQWRLQANRLLASPATQAKEAKGAKSFFSRLFRSS